MAKRDVYGYSDKLRVNFEDKKGGVRYGSSMAARGKDRRVK
jgi:hypothetical protein